jgi:hypothetical protein
MVTPRCSNHNYIVRLRIVAAPLTLQRVVANIDSLLWQPQLHIPPTCCLSPAYSTACCDKHRLPAMATTIALSAYTLSQPRLLYGVLWQT